MGCQFVPTSDVRSVEAAEFRQAMRNLASGVAVVATGANAERRGLTVSSVTSLSLDPPCLLVSVNLTSETHDAILANGRFGVSLLGDGHQDMAMRFAGQEGVKGVRRFETAPWEQGILNVPLLRSAISALECVLHHHHVVGTHGLFVGRIVATREGKGDPLVNHQGALRTFPPA